MAKEYLYVPRWIEFLRAMPALGFGVGMISLRTPTQASMLHLIAFVALSEGIIDIIACIALDRKKKRWDLLGARGLVSLFISIVLITRQETGFQTIILLAAMWIFSWGFIDFICAIPRQQSIAKFLSLGVGVISIGFGIFLVIASLNTVKGFLWCFGIYLVVVACGLIMNWLLSRGATLTETNEQPMGES
ncbi:MAG: DUF308 domain-containing protein [Actinomycetota bacterium]|nr:DUF308 domain-containing protein [Actinomycetota bacterium]